MNSEKPKNDFHQMVGLAIAAIVIAIMVFIVLWIIYGWIIPKIVGVVGLCAIILAFYMLFKHR